MDQQSLLLVAENICVHGDTANATVRSKITCLQEDFAFSEFFQVVVAAAFVMLILSSVVGNTVVMWIIYRHKVMHNAFNYFLFNMALADLFIAICNVGTSWTFNLYYDWWYGDFCAVNLFFGVAPTCVSVFSMMALSWDRYQAVVNPLGRRPISVKKAVSRILFIWFISSLIALPNASCAKVESFWFFITKTQSLIMKRSCSAAFPSWKILNVEVGTIHDHCLLLLQYIIPLIMLAFTFGRIACEFRIPDSIVAITNTRCSINQGKARKKVIQMLALMVAIFMICWLPYHIYHSSREFFQIELEALYIFFYWLAMAPCACNPLIYCFSSKRFRVGFRYAFRCVPFVEFDKKEYTHSSLFAKNKCRKSIVVCKAIGRKITAHTRQYDMLPTSVEETSQTIQHIYQC